MRAALGRGLAKPRPTLAGIEALPISPGLALLAAGLAASVAGSVFAGGGSGDGSIPWIGAGALALAAGASAAALFGSIGWPRLTGSGVAALALLGGFVVWNGASVLWSSAPDRSWDYFNRGLVYTALLVAGMFLGALAPRAPTLVARALALLVASALVWALAGKVFPSLYPDGGRVARLRDPIGYWNALALLFALGLPLALWLATDPGRRRALRAAGVVFAYGLVVGILLTYSRAGVAVALLAVALWIALAPRRREATLALLVAAAGGAVVGAWAFGQPGLAADGQDYSTRAADGAELGLALVLGAGAVWALAFALSRVDPSRPRRALGRLSPRRLALVAATPLAAAAIAAAALKGGEAVAWLDAQAEEFTNPPTELVTQNPSRLASLSSNNRWTWWQEAWRGFRSEPLLGTGAGTFSLTHRRYRDFPLAVTEPHNEALQFLSETGVVGALLAGGAAAAGLLGAAGAVRRLREPQRTPALALAVGLAVYTAHALVDFDWDFLAVSAPAFVVLGVLLAAGRPPRSTKARPLWALAAVVTLAAALSSLAAPWLADRRVEAAYDSLVRGDAAEALGSARRAHSLNPVAFQPLLVRSIAETSLGEVEAARSTLVRAVELQPENPDAWLELGIFELRVAGRPQLALRYFERAFLLDPWGPAGPLRDEAKTALAAQGG